MRFSILIAILLLIRPLVGQVMEENAHWSSFINTGRVTVAVVVEDKFWFSMHGSIIRVDTETHTAHTMSAKEVASSSPLTYIDIWVSPAGEVHLLGNNKYLRVFGGDEWVDYQINGEEYTYTTPRKIVHQEADGTYLMMGDASYDLFRWRPGGIPQRATDYRDAAPWTVNFAVWDQQEQRLWIANRFLNELGFIKQGVYTPVELSQETGDIAELKIDANGVFWLRTEQYISQRFQDSWRTFSLPETATSGQVNFLTLGEDQALLATPNYKLLLQGDGDSFQTIDYSNELQKLPSDQPFVADPKGRIWMVDPETAELGHWQVGDQHWQGISAWLPGSNRFVSSLSIDRDQRVWMSDSKDTYYLSGNGWRPASQMYPDIPEGAHAITFTNKGKPLVRHLSEEKMGYQIYHGPGNWQTITDTLFETTSLPVLQLSEQGHFYVFRSNFVSFDVWDRGGFYLFTPGMFSPVPAWMNDLYIKEDGTHLIASDLGVYERFGSNAVLYPIDSENLPNQRSFPGRYSVKFSPSGTLWILKNGKVFAWHDNIISQLPAILCGEEGLGESLCIYPLADDDVWVLRRDFSLCNFDGIQWHHYPPPAKEFQLTGLIQMFRDQQNRVWMRDRLRISVLTPSDRSPLNLKGSDPFSAFTLAPNPAHQHVIIDWLNEKPGTRQLRLYSADGRLVRELVREEQNEGPQQFVLARNALPSGVYVLVLEGPERREVRKLVWK